MNRHVNRSEDFNNNKMENGDASYHSTNKYANDAQQKRLTFQLGNNESDLGNAAKSLFRINLNKLVKVKYVSFY